MRSPYPINDFHVIDCVAIGFGMKSRLPVRNRLTCPTRRKARFPGPIRLGWSEGLCFLVVMYASRFRNCVCAERNRIGGARRKWGSQRPRATLRWEIHAAQEVLETRVGAQGVKRGSYLQERHGDTAFALTFFQPLHGAILVPQGRIEEGYRTGVEPAIPSGSFRLLHEPQSVVSTAGHSIDLSTACGQF